MIAPIVFPTYNDVWKDLVNLLNSKDGEKYPFTDIYFEFENEETNKVKKLVIELAVAGFKKDEIEIEITDGVLVIKGHKQSNQKNEMMNRHYLKKTIAMRSFKKEYKLMFDVDEINASLKDGILKIEIIPSKQITKKIEIE